MKYEIHPFLAVNHPEQGEFLIVEGWMPAYALDESANFFKLGHYKKILTSGGQAKGQWSFKHGVTYALLAAEQIRRSGFDSNLVEAVSGPLIERDRTYHSALAIKDWLQANHQNPASIDVLTMGPHARRSRLLFQEAMGKSIKVGVICIEDNEYDANHWWRSSEGVREVISESIAYLYAKFIFYPSAHPDEGKFDEN
jgi:hypothetical protein